MNKRLRRKIKDLLKAAYYAVKTLYQYTKKPRFTEGFILDTHSLILAEKPGEAGRYRDARHVLDIKGGTFTPVQAHLIKIRITELVDLMNNRRRWRGIYHKFLGKKVDPKIKADQELNSFIFSVFIAFYFHHSFVVIHPFSDGNGRMARLLMCLLLRELGVLNSSYPPLINKIIKKSRGKYLDALNAADTGNYSPAVNYMLDVIRQAYIEAQKVAAKVNSDLKGVL